MRHLSTRSVISPLFAHTLAALVLAALVLVTASPASASSQGQLTVTLPDGSTPKELFAETTLVPGGTTKETLIVSQNTDEIVKTGIRFESQSPHGPLHEDAELTIDGLGSSTTVPLGDGLDTESPFWLGSLSPEDEATVTIRVHLPESSGNDTQRAQALFRIIVTAQGEGGTAPTPTASPTDPSDSSGDEDSATDGSSEAGSSADADDSRGGSSDASASSEGSAQAGSSVEASASTDSTANSDANGSDNPGGDLPRTGVSVFAALLIAAALLAAGIFAVRAARVRFNSDNRHS